MLDRTTKEALSVDAAISNSHKLSKKLQKYADLKEELISGN
jgi:hypothetical protein